MATTNDELGSRRRENAPKENEPVPENVTEPLSPPVRQHNPKDKGINPDQKGPVQPDNK